MTARWKAASRGKAVTCTPLVGGFLQNSQIHTGVLSRNAGNTLRIYNMDLHGDNIGSCIKILSLFVESKGVKKLKLEEAK